MPKHNKLDKLKDPRSFPAPYPSIWTILCGKLKEIATRTGREGSQDPIRPYMTKNKGFC